FPTLYVQKANISKLAGFQGPLLVANDNVAPGMPGSAGGSAGDGGVPAEDGSLQGEPPPGKIPANDDDEKPRPAVNRAPRTTGPLQLDSVFGCGAVLIGLSDLLANASDPDGDVLSVKNLRVSSGTITWAGTGWLYEPN